MQMSRPEGGIEPPRRSLKVWTTDHQSSSGQCKSCEWRPLIGRPTLTARRVELIGLVTSTHNIHSFRRSTNKSQPKWSTCQVQRFKWRNSSGKFSARAAFVRRFHQAPVHVFQNVPATSGGLVTTFISFYHFTPHQRIRTFSFGPEVDFIENVENVKKIKKNKKKNKKMKN